MKTYHIPIRMCVVCRETSAKKTLLRVYRLPEAKGGGVAVDPGGKASGRGAYVCTTPECLEKAIKQKRFERSLKVASVPPELADQLRILAEADASAGATVL